MYRILLAEDEAILREGVSEEFADTGMYSVDTAANGEEALELAKVNKYDAIILDIRMPKMDGMQLLKCLSQIGNDSIKVIMSGYADFHYAKKGIEYGVSDYVVKPLAPDRIRSLAEKIAGMIDHKQKAQGQVEILKAQLRDTRPMRTDIMFLHMANGAYSGSETEQRLEKEDIVFDDGPLNVLIVHNLPEDERPSCSYPAFRISANTAAIVITSGEEAVLRAAEKITEKYPERELICAVSDEQAGIERLKEAYVCAEEALKYAQLLEKSGIIRYSDVKSSGSNIFLDELEFRMLLGLAKRNELQSMVERLFEDIPLNASRQDYYSLSIYIAMLCQNNVKKLSAEKANMIVDYEEVLKVRTLKGIKAWTGKLIDTACEQINDNSRQRSILEVEKTKAYIDEHLSEDISMGDLAKNAYLSPNYLGKVFYEKIGLSVSEYINRRRIERACELIRNGNAKVYEIAEMVGIRDPNYFSSLFKKIVGISPKEYKSLVGAQERVRRV